MSPGNQGVFHLLKEEAQPEIAREDGPPMDRLLFTKSSTIYFDRKVGVMV